MSKSDTAKTVALAEKDMPDAVRLLRLFSDPARVGQLLAAQDAPGHSEAGVLDRQALLAKARSLLSGRRNREQFFHRGLFGEPAWDILLALYVAQEAGPRFTVGKLAEGIGVPLTTAVRWVKSLEEHGLVSKHDHPTDRRIAFIHLLDNGRKALDRYLSSLPG